MQLKMQGTHGRGAAAASVACVLLGLVSIVEGFMSLAPAIRSVRLRPRGAASSACGSVSMVATNRNDGGKDSGKFNDGLKGYVIVPADPVSATGTKTATRAGWTLWDQRTKGVTVVIGNSKQRKQQAKEGKHFGPLSMPDMAKFEHKLKELKDAKKEMNDEVEKAEKEHQREDQISVLKKKKLAIKDRIAILEARIKSHTPTDYQPKMLGEGAYGAILLGRDIKSGEGVAIKVEPITGTSIETGISYEYSVFSKLKGVKGFPIVKYFGQQKVMNRDCKVMVMELLGESVEDLWWDVTGGGRGFDTGTALAVGEEMLGLLQKLHDRGYVHRDVKPDNFLVHNPDGTGHLVLIDLGISKGWRDEATGGHVGISKGNDFFGTCRYASVNAHQGLEQSRRDDLESLVYTIAFLLTGSLPWEEPTSDVGKVGGRKLRAVDKIALDAGCSIDGEEQDEACKLLDGMPAHCASMVRNFLLYCRGLEYDQDPDYDHLRGMIVEAYKAETGTETFSRIYEWAEFKRKEKLETEAEGGKATAKLRD